MEGLSGKKVSGGGSRLDKGKMKILIVYASRTGSAERAARILGDCFDDAYVADLGEGSPDPTGFDAVIFGSGIRFGRIHRPLRRWLERYWQVIRPMPKAVFICNALVEEAPAILKDNFSLNLRNSSIVVDTFGGEFDPDRLSFLERILYGPEIRRIAGRGGRELVPVILTDRIRIFADEVKYYLEAREKLADRPLFTEAPED